MAKKSVYLNRELSWLAFNERVLLEAADRSVPLLERLKFLMIYQSNLEEFYRVRIGILTHRAMLTPDKKDPPGRTPRERRRRARLQKDFQSGRADVQKAVRGYP